MTITIILVLAGFFSLAALLLLARGAASRGDLSSLKQRLHSVDIEAFRNLIDPGEGEFLRRHLRPVDFRRVQRARMAAAVEYIRSASHNAAILQRIGEASRGSVNPSVAEAANKLVNNAIRFRLYAAQGIARLYLAMIFPGAGVQRLQIAEGYQRMTLLVTLLSCMQSHRPATRGPGAAQLAA